MTGHKGAIRKQKLIAESWIPASFYPSKILFLRSKTPKDEVIVCKLGIYMTKLRPRKIQRSVPKKGVFIRGEVAIPAYGNKVIIVWQDVTVKATCRPLLPTRYR